MAISLGGFSGGGSGSVTGGLVYKGAFNATAGTPSIADARQGDFYVIDTAGTIYGQTWAINDHLLINADMGGSVTNSKIDKIDNTEPTNVLITTNNLSDLNNVGTARTNLGLGTAATVDTGTSNGNVVILDATGLPAVDGSQLTGVTSTDATKLAIANNLSDLNNAGTARTNLGLGTAATAASTDFLQVSNNLSDVTAATARTNLGLGTAATVDTGTSNGNVVVLDATGLPAVDGSQLTGVTSTDSSKLAIANNLSDLNNAGTARTNLGLGTAATAASTDFLQVSNNLSDVTAATARTNLGLGTAATAASTDFLSATGADTLGGNLDVGSSDIVSSSNADIEIAPDGTGKVTIKGNATGGSGAIVLNCENNSHGITLAGPAHSAAATYKLIYPTTVGTAGQVLKTDGGDGGSPDTVQLDWVTQSGGGAAGWTYSAITADPANAQADYHYSCTGTFTITLPTSGVSAGKEIRVKNMGSGTITIDPQTQNIDGSTTDYVLDVQYSAITLVSTGTHWEVI